MLMMSMAPDAPRYGYTRGLTNGDVSTVSTGDSNAQITGGSFGTGVATSQGISQSITLLQDPEDSKELIDPKGKKG